MLTKFPPPSPAREDSHEARDIDEVSFESDVGHITHPDLIASTDFKGLQVIDPRTQTVGGVRRLTHTFDSNREVLGFQQARNTPIPNGGSRLYQQVRDTSIPIPRIRHSSLFYFGSQDIFRGVDVRWIIEVARRETQPLANLSHRVLRP